MKAFMNQVKKMVSRKPKQDKGNFTSQKKLKEATRHVSESFGRAIVRLSDR